MIFSQKAIDESEKEWAQNKKLVDLRKKDIRHSVPKGFPYFAVDFGLQGGYAHVIEDEQSFPAYFGKVSKWIVGRCTGAFWVGKQMHCG